MSSAAVTANWIEESARAERVVDGASGKVCAEAIEQHSTAKQSNGLVMAELFSGFFLSDKTKGHAC